MSQKPDPSYCIQFILILCALSLGLACTPTYAHAMKTDPTLLYAQTHSPDLLSPPKGAYVPNELVIYFATDCAPHTRAVDWACAEPQKGGIRDSLMNVLTRIGVAIGLPLPQTPTPSHLAHLQELNTTYGLLESTRLTDEDAHLDSSPYIFRFREDVSLQEARLAYENLKEVLYVQYNYIYTLP